MRDVLGIGETIYDILFKDGVPMAAVPGGSVFNTLMTLGRIGIKSTHIGEIGSDEVGAIIKSAMEANNVNTNYLSCYEGKKTAISLAHLDSQGNAHYSFYKDYPNVRLEFELPPITEESIVLFGSYYALNPVIRRQVYTFLQYANRCRATLYYDLNFRQNHSHEVEELRESFVENFRLADIVKGSDEDFTILFGTDSIKTIYDQHIRKECQILIMTHGANGVEVIDHGWYHFFPSIRVDNIVSTIGAGDNFNAGIVYGLIAESLYRSNLDSLTSENWSRVINCGITFATKACQTTKNHIEIDVTEL